jgi:hypothetical protein
MNFEEVRHKQKGNNLSEGLLWKDLIPIRIGTNLKLFTASKHQSNVKLINYNDLDFCLNSFRY